jgi:hypothetical protein
VELGVEGREEGSTLERVLTFSSLHVLSLIAHSAPFGVKGMSM